MRYEYVVSNGFRERREQRRRLVERAARWSRRGVFEALVSDQPAQELEVGKVYGTRRFPEHLQITVVSIRSLRHHLSQLATHDVCDRSRTGSSI